jgi:hypothetical protein
MTKNLKVGDRLQLFDAIPMFHLMNGAFLS